MQSTSRQPSSALQRADGLPAEGFVRLRQIIAPLGPIPVSRSTWWSWVAKGIVPRPVKLGPGISCWRVEDVRALLQKD